MQQPSIRVIGTQLIACLHSHRFIVRSSCSHAIHAVRWIINNLSCITFSLQCILQSFRIGLQAETSTYNTICLQTCSTYQFYIFPTDRRVILFDRSGRSNCLNRNYLGRGFNVVACISCNLAFSYAFLYALSEDLQDVMANAAHKLILRTTNFFMIIFTTIVIG